MRNKLMDIRVEVYEYEGTDTREIRIWRNDSVGIPVEKITDYEADVMTAILAERKGTDE